MMLCTEAAAGKEFEKTQEGTVSATRSEIKTSLGIATGEEVEEDYRGVKRAVNGRGEGRLVEFDFFSPARIGT